MSLSKNRTKFEAHQKRLIEQNEKRGKSSNFNNPNQLKFEANKTYKVRLLFDESEKRKQGETYNPFVNKYVHGGKNAQGKWNTVTCPTTHGRAGFDTCPVCIHNNKLWKSWIDTGMERDKTLYDMYKRKFNGFALCYVINDPTTPENNSHVKYFRFSIRQHRWLQREIFGIIDNYNKSEEDKEVVGEEDITGYDAFELEAGYDLIITVTKQGEYLNYDYKFARKATAIDAEDFDVLEDEIVEVDFDRHITSSSDEDLQNFYRTVVMSSDDLDDISTKDGGVEEESIDIDDLDDVNETKDTSSDEADEILDDADIASILDEIEAESE